MLSWNRELQLTQGNDMAKKNCALRKLIRLKNRFAERYDKEIHDFRNYKIIKHGPTLGALLAGFSASLIVLSLGKGIQVEKWGPMTTKGWSQCMLGVAFVVLVISTELFVYAGTYFVYDMPEGMMTKTGAALLGLPAYSGRGKTNEDAFEDCLKTCWVYLKLGKYLIHVGTLALMGGVGILVYPESFALFLIIMVGLGLEVAWLIVGWVSGGTTYT